MKAKIQIFAALILFSFTGITTAPAQQIKSNISVYNVSQVQNENADLTSQIASADLNSSEDIDYEIAEDRFDVPNDDDEEVLQNSA